MSIERVPQATPLEGFRRYQAEYEDAALDVLRGGHYILGPQVAAFEQSFAQYLDQGDANGTVVGVASGLDALVIALRALGIGAGDEVIVPANTYIASVMAITMNGATPVFVEPDKYFNIDPRKLESCITDKTRAVMAVHLFGQACQMDKIAGVCQSVGLRLVEDCAQSHGARFNGQMTGTFGDAGCFSFYPTKNLGAFGDGGAVWCRTPELAAQIRVLRNYGSSTRYHNDVVGYNSRLDELQSALLLVKLRHLNELTEERRTIADRYNAEIVNPLIARPECADGCEHVYHQYVIRVANKQMRQELQDHLGSRGIDTLIHYPIPPHLATCYRSLGHKRGDFPVTEDMSDTILSVPVFNGMSSSQISRVIEAINEFK
ncbi:MAG: DegT/DnrJ/EryC1/StrS family aminotransferase [Propionibacteriaceae bacterium]|nr:DegT/DnrJ/EryC1/StrS family aminotransferase [Propionibacteriaceae bacterium]